MPKRCAKGVSEPVSVGQGSHVLASDAGDQSTGLQTWLLVWSPAPMSNWLGPATLPRWLEVVFQRELDVPRPLGRTDDPQIGAQAIVRRVQDRVVESVEELGPELEVLSLPYRERLGNP